MQKKYLKTIKCGSVEETTDIKLSDREQQVLRLIAAGKTNREIASDLFVAEVTVIKTVTSIYRKLDISGAYLP